MSRARKSDGELKETALHIAFLRCAYASFRDPGLQYDTRALEFEGKVLQAFPTREIFGRQSTLAGARQFAEALESGVSDPWRGMIYNLARARVVDEIILGWVADGQSRPNAVEQKRRQLVVLGAGLDFRAHRHAQALANINVFELDLPSMVALRRSLARHFPVIPEHFAGNSHLLPIDFNKEDLGEVLDRAGFDRTAPSLYVWEGVTYYLTPEAVIRTLALIRHCSAPGSQLLFDYLDAAVVDGTHPDPNGERMRRTFAQFEPLIWGLNFDAAEEFAESKGFRVLHHWRPQELEETYLCGNQVSLQGSPFFAIMLLVA
eukprot:gnl/MRDRNA2_/MRDRNA2_148020_c0_seq1.p1 gnl/MRDRNA2_/MRDRNA2_148020_c0~~gnl/MRDRNA2_/MRDRNA2_148020_c0_seq1.p1  ORF type:complete len:318 (+),score=49.30 gnl/MRDRNA2_/MRDRNA2_148020_c0_seq1:62-1015(+)